MDFIEKLQEISKKIEKQKDTIQTEEATKNAFVLPFISALGYDIFDPTEVVPEYTADFGLKKGEKVDYAIVKNGKPIILIECKKLGTDLIQENLSQLFRYFTSTGARIGILTDGVIYRFYTDLESPNKMDEKPFLEFNILDIQNQFVNEIKKLNKDSFNIDELMTVASELKYTREIKNILLEQMKEPSDEFVKCFASKVYSGMLTQKIRVKFSEFTKKALNQFINDMINERLKSAMTTEEKAETKKSEKILEKQEEVGKPIITTEEELEGYYIVKSILREVVKPERVYKRDTISYFGILLDDTNRKPICRLYFNQAKKYIVLFDEIKKETKQPIDNLNDIYKYAEQLKKTVSFYINPNNLKANLISPANS